MNEQAYIIPVSGEIGKDFKYTDLLMHLNNSKECSVIQLVIDSLGGSVDEGLKIHDHLISSGKIIKSTNSGNICSIAVSIFLSAPKENRTFDPAKGKFIIHNPWLKDIEGDSNTLDQYSNHLKSLEKTMASEYADCTGTSKDILKGFMDQSEPLTNDQIQSLGFATIINSAQIKPIAYFNIEKMDTKEIKKEIKTFDGFLKKIMAKLGIDDKVKALVVQDVNGTELDFGDAITDPSQIIAGISGIQVGGKPAEGEFTMPDGSVYNISKGTLTEIEPKATEDSEEMKVLKAENEQLKAEIEKVKAQASETKDVSAKALIEIKKEFSNFKAKFNEVEVVPPSTPAGNQKPKGFSFRSKRK